MEIFNPVLLIDEVHKRPCLYNTEYPADREEKLSAWKEIGAAIYPDWGTINKATAYDRVLQLQKKWRSIKDAYGRELRLRRSGGHRSRRTYRYFKRLTFLGGHDGPVSDGGDDSGDSNSGVFYESKQHEERARQDSPEVVEVEAARPKRKKRRKREPSADGTAPEEVEMPMFPVELDNSDERDCDRLFFMSFLPELRQLPSHLKMWVRAQVANVMQEAVACHYNNTTPGNSSEQNDVKQPPHDSPH